MRIVPSFLAGVAALSLASAYVTPANAKTEAPLAAEPRLVQMAESPYQWTGIAVSKTGRVFVNFPRWSPSIPMSVGELDSTGKVRPYPNEKLNSWLLGEDPKGKFVCRTRTHTIGTSCQSPGVRESARAQTR